MGGAGGAAAAVGLAAVLAVELVLMQRLNRRDAVPLATAAQLLRAWWHEGGCGPVDFGWRQPLWWRSPPDWLPAQPTGRRGVVLVHGLMCNRGVWLHWLGHLRAAGHAHVAVNLEPVLGSIDGYAKAIDEAVRRVTEATGLPPVLVCHSMGGLAARAWLRAYAADARVHRVLTLGTPHAGTWLARFSHTENGRQMRMNSAWLQALKAQEPPSRAKLFVCWYSNCDNIVFPATVAALPGAQHRLVTGVAHVQMVLDPRWCRRACGSWKPRARAACAYAVRASLAFVRCKLGLAFQRLVDGREVCRRHVKQLLEAVDHKVGLLERVDLVAGAHGARQLQRQALRLGALHRVRQFT